MGVSVTPRSSSHRFEVPLPIASCNGRVQARVDSLQFRILRPASCAQPPAPSLLRSELCVLRLLKRRKGVVAARERFQRARAHV